MDNEGKQSTQALADIAIEEMLAGQGYEAICGVDEVGRGPLAGPVVAAAVILPNDLEIPGIKDSKQLTAAQRDKAFDLLVNLELPIGIGIMDHHCIDRINILKASLMAMRKAVTELRDQARVVLVDGNHCVPNLKQPQYAIVGGDKRCRSIAAASIIAKVTRDRIMARYEELSPGFSFAKHKGYPTPAHLEELRRLGPCEIHRKSYKPVAELLSQHVLF